MEAGPRRPHKYHATPRNVDGLTQDQAEALGLKFTKFYDSSKEATRHWELKELEKAGKISSLQWQARYQLIVNDLLVCTYISDATYLDHDSGQVVVEDVKGGNFRTDVYRLKRKLLKACLGIEVQEV